MREKSPEAVEQTTAAWYEPPSDGETAALNWRSASSELGDAKTHLNHAHDARSELERKLAQANNILDGATRRHAVAVHVERAARRRLEHQLERAGRAAEPTRCTPSDLGAYGESEAKASG